MRRLFIIRKDLHLSPGKLAAMVAHAAELWWINKVKYSKVIDPINDIFKDTHNLEIKIPWEIWNNYICDIYTKTICEAKNLNDLQKKVIEFLKNHPHLKLSEDYGHIVDHCKTELTPENPDGTTTIGMWFAPIEDEIIQELSKKFKLYRG